MNCKYCKKECVKTGIRNNLQRYRCKQCRKYQQRYYLKPRIAKRKYDQVRLLSNEGCSISSISRLLKIAKSSVQRLIIRISSTISKPVFAENGQSYEMDELRTFCGNKQNESWVIYAINLRTKRVIDFCVGRRTKENIHKVIQSLLKLNPKHIYTDKLNIYRSLLCAAIHKIYPKCTNHIERKNLTLRTNQKRLNRKTICFSRSENMLNHCLKIYFAA